MAGKTIDGGFVEYMLATAERVYPVLEGLRDAEAAILKPGGIAVLGVSAQVGEWSFDEKRLVSQHRPRSAPPDARGPVPRCRPGPALARGRTCSTAANHALSATVRGGRSTC
jgi:hypothetical protein